jgi:hypothetical protein
MTAMARNGEHDPGPADQALSEQALSEQALSEQALSDQALSEQALSEQALSEQALSEQALSEQGPGEQGPGEQGPGRRGRGDAPVTKRLLATVLIMETVVIWLAIPVALAVEHASPRRAGVAGVVLAVVAVVLAVAARRRLRWTIVGGSVLQALVIAAGVIVPVMYFLGAIFAAFWVIGLRMGRRFDVAS